MKKSRPTEIIIVGGTGKGRRSLDQVETYWRALVNGGPVEFRQCSPSWSQSGNQSLDILKNVPIVDGWLEGRTRSETVFLVCPDGLPSIAREAIRFSHKGVRQKFEVSTPVFGEDGSVLRTVEEYL